MPFMCALLGITDSLHNIAYVKFDAHRKFEMHMRFGNAAYCIKSRLATKQLE